MLHRSEHGTKLFSALGNIPGKIPRIREWHEGFSALGKFPGKMPFFQSATVVLQPAPQLHWYVEMAQEARQGLK